MILDELEAGAMEFDLNGEGIMIVNVKILQV